MDPEKLLLHIHAGGELNADEVEQLTSYLENTPVNNCEAANLENVYSCLLVLGKARALKYRPLFEKFLELRDPMTVGLILEILCVDWKEADNYVEQLLHFTFGLSWDYDNDVQDIAIKILGETLKTIREQRLAEGKSKPLDLRYHRVLQHLIKIFRDDSQDEWIRQRCYLALARFSGKEWEELPSDQVLIDIGEESQDMDIEVLSYCSDVLSSGIESSSRATVSELFPSTR